MGYKLLIGALLATTLFASRYPDIDRLIEQVKVQREGLSKKEIAKLKNPFIDEEKLQKVIIKQKIIKKRKQRRVVYRLQSIFDRRVKINGRWYTLGSKVGKYHIFSINADKGYVVLKSKKETLRLFLSRKSKRFRLISKPMGSR